MAAASARRRSAFLFKSIPLLASAWISYSPAALVTLSVLFPAIRLFGLNLLAVRVDRLRPYWMG